ncbi:hypothetical protein Tco_0381916 [Tanacetum coccineum]
MTHEVSKVRQKYRLLGQFIEGSGAASSDVEKNSSDCGKRKLTTYEDSDVFETYSQLSARNVRPRFSSDLPQASGANTSQPVYNEVNIRVILLSIHGDDGNPSRVNIKQLCDALATRTASAAVKPCQGDSFEST